MFEDRLAIFAMTNTCRPKRHRQSMPPVLKAAACFTLALGIGAFAIAAPPIFEAVTHTTQRAVAGEPLRPYQRIEFSNAYFACFEEPSYVVPAQFDPDDQYYGTLTSRLFLPGIPEDEYEISLLNAPDIRVCTEDVYTVNLDVPAEKTSVTVSKDNNYVFSFVWPVKMTPKTFQDAFGAEGSGFCVESEMLSFIDSIRDVRIAVKTSDVTEVYRLDYGALTDLMSLRRAFVHQECRPLMATLVNESESA